MNQYMISPGEIAVRLLVAALLGGMVGWERERKDGVAGLRTHMLVCIGSALVMMVSAFGFGDVLGRPDIVLDPSRVAAQVISGIGFLGAGTILFLRPQIIRGLTTAAGLWSVAAVGLAVGGGMYWAAGLTTVIILVILAIIKPLERFIHNDSGHTLTIMFDAKKIALAQIETVINKYHLSMAEIFVHSIKDSNHHQMKINFDDKSRKNDIMSVVDELNAMDGIEEMVSNLNK